MTKSMTFAALLMTGFAMPALAASENGDATATAEALTALSFEANAKQVQTLLGSQGYTQVAVLGRDEHGRWTGVAMKDGQQRVIAVDLRSAQPQPVTN